MSLLFWLTWFAQAAQGATSPTADGSGPAEPAAIGRQLDAVARLPRAEHSSRIRATYDRTRDRTKVWIDSNEDDTRIWTLAGKQMDIDFQVSFEVSGRLPGSLPAAVSMVVASRGSLQPSNPPHNLELAADGRALALTQISEPPSRSGALLFLSTSAEVPLSEFLAITTARRVEGQIWGHRFALLDAQLELLRAFVMALRSPPAPDGS